MFKGVIERGLERLKGWFRGFIRCDGVLDDSDQVVDMWLLVGLEELGIVFEDVIRLLKG